MKGLIHTEKIKLTLGYLADSLLSGIYSARSFVARDGPLPKILILVGSVLTLTIGMMLIASFIVSTGG